MAQSTFWTEYPERIHQIKEQAFEWFDSFREISCLHLETIKKSSNKTDMVSAKNQVLQKRIFVFLNLDQVSVIVPVYNAEEYLEKAVHSIFGLEEVVEVLLIEDGSPDHSLQITTKLKADIRIK